MNTRVDHEAILASAGSGKTYQLANRIVRLLASGADAGTILALTFTRKAAGEFARRTLVKLAAAAQSDATARSLAEELQLADGTDWDAAHFAALLAQTVRQLHRLQLSTLDSFYQRLARMASFELGLPGAFTLLDERMADAAKERVLRRIFQRAPAGDAVHRDFLAAFRLATWGREARGVTHELEQFVDAAAALLRDFPDADSWGGAVGMPAGKACPWLPVPSPEAVAGALTALETFAAQNATGGRTPASALATFAGAVRKWGLGQPLNDLGTFFEKTLLTAAPQILRGDGTDLIFNKKNLFAPPPVCDALAVVLRYLIGGALERHRQMTRGIYLLARQYDDTYDRLVRRAGQLTFADTVDMLSQHNLDIGFRLDGTTHHWLFDEFQDTSRRDWSVVADNLDAVLTDDSGERSAFLVGDVKQALYGWRGGDHSLLPKLCARYQLAPRALDVSWRSTPDVLAMPNAVFGNLKNAAAFLPAVTVAEWQRHWQTHSAAGGMAKKQGYAAWHICEKTGVRADGTANNALRLGVVLERLREVRPFERGLTCGLLTQTNKEAREATRFLRDAGFRATSEADVPVAEDNPIVPAFLALLGVASHPHDGYAEGIVKATAPIAAWVAGRSGMAKARAFLLDSIIATGFAPTLRTVADELGAALPDDAFSARRIGQLFATAREFDATGNRDTDDFVRFAQRSLRRDTSEADSVQVMTIHKAKGLEFDIVFLPFLEGNRLDSARKDNLLTLEHQVLSNPGKLICEHTQGLSANLKTREADACYEELCRLYVALTRARYATCVITTAAGASKTPDGVNFPTLLELTLGVGENAQPAWESGARDWFCAVPLLAPSSVPSPTAPPATAAMAPRRQWVRRRPSEAGQASVPSAMLFARQTRGATFGRCVHELLAAVSFFDADGTDAAEARVAARAEALRHKYSAEVLAAALAQVSAMLHSAALREVFSAPVPSARLWRERSFDVILDNTWVSGIFDRVVFGDGELWLQDFKTDTDATPEGLLKRHAGQLRLYRRALARLTGVAESRIHAQLIHVSGRSVVAVANGL